MNITQEARDYLYSLLSSELEGKMLFKVYFVRVDVFPTTDAGPTFELYDIEREEVLDEDVIYDFGDEDYDYHAISIVVHKDKDRYFRDLTIGLKEDDNKNPIIVFYKDNG
jgi:hypothetical protein